MTPLERRVGRLISTYADRAPIRVDPMAMTQLAAAGHARAPIAWRLAAPQRSLAFLLVVVALLAAIAASSLLVGAQLLRRDPIAVVATHFEQRGYVYVYEDGRVIVDPGYYMMLSEGMASGTVGQRRLTREGVEMVRSGSLDPAAFLDGSEMAVPERLWADPSFHQFKPSSYAICYSIDHENADPISVVDLLPASLQATLRGKERVFEATRVSFDGQDVESESRECTELRVDEGPALEEALTRTGRHQSSDEWFVSVTSGGSSSTIEIRIVRHPIMPHGGWVYYPYG